jgi:UDP-glucose 4-epimerase
MIEGQRICVTGGAGFIGSTLVQRLVDQNEVVVLDNMGRNRLGTLSCRDHPNLGVIEGDVLDPAAVHKAVKGADLVIHCAGIAGIDTVVKKPVDTLAVNMIGSYNVLEAARTLSRPPLVICFSTSEVFGPQAFSSKETDPTIVGAVGKARWTYAVSKLAEEHLAISFYKQHGLPTTVLRPFNVYGPGQVGEGAIKIFIERAIRDEPITIYGGGNQIRAWCYVDDMVEAVTKAIESPAAVGESFNIGNSRSVETIWGLANQIIRLTGSSSEIVFRPALSADIELRIPCVDKAREVLNFTAKVDLEEGVRRTAAYYRSLMTPAPVAASKLAEAGARLGL